MRRLIIPLPLFVGVIGVLVHLTPGAYFLPRSLEQQQAANIQDSLIFVEKQQLAIADSNIIARVVRQHIAPMVDGQ